MTGNRTAETLTSGGGTVTTGSGYPGAGQAQPHTLTSQTVSGPSGTATSSYRYDAAGNTTSRSAGGVSQALTWNQEGHLASVTDAAHGHTTSYVYDADGNLLVRHDDATATLYLPGEELALSGGRVSATRYYSHAGNAVAARTPAGLTWLVADPHGTATISVDTSTQAPSERRFLPFGAERGPLPASWPGDRGFVGGVEDPTTGSPTWGRASTTPPRAASCRLTRSWTATTRSR